MFEILNERKNLENQRIGEKRRVIYSRDIILNLAGVDLESSHEVLVTVVIVPPNSTVAEMAVYPRIPFFVVRNKDHVTGDAAISKLPTMLDVNFSFGKDSVTSALAVNNRSRGKIFFINGYQPCKTDLDVHRAMLDVEVDKELYPLVHRWKTLVSSRVANPSCCWPSPARMHRQGNLSASFPQVSTPRQTTAESPVVFYRSPIARTPTRQKMSSTWSMPNIRSQLFPPRSPLRDSFQ
ncbi:hypothetical protein FSP39_002047 [Pinctada imbricata]|uniref:Uncharacterized protein n=1 Tax=Pinctada imbricata TaxID=66713 RepID=A0AA88Y6R7_PINIB|nr:hypothetical protein FSP39_002047 [Pinctada imbricata]